MVLGLAPPDSDLVDFTLVFICTFIVSHVCLQSVVVIMILCSFNVGL